MVIQPPLQTCGWSWSWRGAAVKGSPAGGILLVSTVVNLLVVRVPGSLYLPRGHFLYLLPYFSILLVLCK